MENKKPPLGIVPLYLHKEFRLQEIDEAIKRYIDAGQPIPVAWFYEFHETQRWLDQNREEKAAQKEEFKWYEQYPTPTEIDVSSPEFNAVWDAIKRWDIQRQYGVGYCGATGSDVMYILNAIKQSKSGGTPTAAHSEGLNTVGNKFDAKKSAWVKYTEDELEKAFNAGRDTNQDTYGYGRKYRTFSDYKNSHP